MKKVIKLHIGVNKKIYISFIIVSLAFFLLSYILYSKHIDAPVDVIFNIGYSIFSIPLFGIFIVGNSYIKTEEIPSENKMLPLLLSLVLPFLIMTSILVLYMTIHVSSGMYPLNELYYFVAFTASGLVILIALSVIYFEIVNKSKNWLLFFAKILMFFSYFVLMFFVEELFNIDVMIVGKVQVVIFIVFSIHLTIDLLWAYSKLIKSN